MLRPHPARRPAVLAVLVALLVPFLPSFTAMASAAPAGALASWTAKVLPFPARDEGRR